MSQYVTAIRTADGDKQIDYNALANKPNLEDISTTVISAQAPSNKKSLWVDTANSSILKYYNGSAWIPVGAVWK